MISICRMWNYDPCFPLFVELRPRFSLCGLTLKELGRYAGMNIRAVSQAAKRIEARLKSEKGLSTAYRKTLKMLGEAKV